MNTYSRMLHELQTPEVLDRIRALYGQRDGMLQRQLSRYVQAVKAHMELFGSPEPLYLISAPGRVEIAGNHTDHQNGCVLAGQVASMVTREQTAREIITEMFGEAEAVLNGATKWVK